MGRRRLYPRSTRAQLGARSWEFSPSSHQRHTARAREHGGYAGAREPGCLTSNWNLRIHVPDEMFDYLEKVDGGSKLVTWLLREHEQRMPTRLHLKEKIVSSMPVATVDLEVADLVLVTWCHERGELETHLHLKHLLRRA